MHSLLVQAFVFAIPIVASVAAATAVSAIGPRPQTVWQFVGWWVVLTAVALVALLLVDRLARKLLPLATLLKLSMLFPDRAPSRFRVARNAASVRKLAEQLEAARERGLTAEPVWAAETVLTLITALGHHDRRSRGHSERVHVYTELLADELDLPEFDRDRLRWAALLHDVGKLVVPSELLNKAGSPDDDEWSALRQHPEAGAELCAPLLAWLGEWGLAIPQHHEWYDGTGYPNGLSGHEISRAARIVAVADCYEVMTTSRTYKRAMNPAAAREELARCAGSQFDPAIVRAFLNVSIGRLRLAMGPLAMLSTLPSMARLTSFIEPLARAGAVLGGAAVIVSGGTVLPSDATAEPAHAPRLPGPTVVAEDSPGSPGLPNHGASEAGAGTREHTEVAAVIEERTDRASADRKLRPSPDRRPPVAPGTSRDDDDDTAAVSGEATPTETPAPRPQRPTPAAPPAEPDEDAGSDESTDDAGPATTDDAADSADEQRGANPTPPTEPPGHQPGHPSGPPANPQPPGNPDPGTPASPSSP